MELNGQVVRDGLTVTAVVGVTVYFVYENNKLKKQIAELKEETTTLAKYVKVLETKFGTLMNQVMSSHPTQNPREYVRKRRNSSNGNINGYSESEEEDDGRSSEENPYSENEYEEEYVPPRRNRPKTSVRRRGRSVQNNQYEEGVMEEAYVERDPRSLQNNINQPIRRVVKTTQQNRDHVNSHNNTPIINNAPNLNSNIAESNDPVKIEIIEDGDLLGDIEEMANAPNSEGVVKTNEGRQTGNKVRERMNRTKQIAEAMKKKREERVRMEQEKATK